MNADLTRKASVHEGGVQMLAVELALACASGKIDRAECQAAMREIGFAQLPPQLKDGAADLFARAVERDKRTPKPSEFISCGRNVGPQAGMVSTFVFEMEPPT